MNNEQFTLQEIERRLKKQEQRPILAFHTHTGIDMNKVKFDDLDRRREVVYHTLFGATAATAANFGVFFIAYAPCIVTAFKEVHETAGTDGGAVTLQLEKLTGTQALDAGTTVLATALDLKATANTVQTGVFATSTSTVPLSSLNLAVGDRLALKDAGALTSLAGVTVLLEVTFTT